METKKTDRANLEKKRSVFFQIGLLIALGFTFVAFEWQFAPRVSDIKWEDPTPVGGYDIVVSRTLPETPPPPAPPQPSLDLEIVDDDMVLDDELFDFKWDLGENVLPTDIFVPVKIEDEDEDFIFNPVEASALFKGRPAEEAFREYIRDNLNYPQIAINNGISGKVFIQFVVDQKGNVVDVQVTRGVDSALDNEAVRLIKSSSGMWTPGKQREKPVKVRYTFPITFKLQ